MTRGRLLEWRLLAQEEPMIEALNLSSGRWLSPGELLLVSRVRLR